MNVETFVFGTRLTRITRQLKKRDVDDAARDAPNPCRIGQAAPVSVMPYTFQSQMGQDAPDVVPSSLIT